MFIVRFSTGNSKNGITGRGRFSGFLQVFAGRRFRKQIQLLHVGEPALDGTRTGNGRVDGLAGLIQAAAGFCRLGVWFRMTSPAVVYGMLAGIGILIVASQVHVLVDASPLANGLDNLMAIPSALLGAGSGGGQPGAGAG